MKSESGSSKYLQPARFMECRPEVGIFVTSHSCPLACQETCDQAARSPGSTEQPAEESFDFKLYALPRCCLAKSKQDAFRAIKSHPQ